MIEGSRLLTAREVAEEFGVGTATVWRWVHAGRLAHIRTPGGRQMRFTEQAVRQAREEARRDERDDPGGPDEAPPSDDGATRKPPAGGWCAAGCDYTVSGYHARRAGRVLCELR